MPTQCKSEWIFSVYLTFPCDIAYLRRHLQRERKSKINDLPASIQWNHFIAIIYHCVNITEFSMQKNIQYRRALSWWKQRDLSISLHKLNEMLSNSLHEMIEMLNSSIDEQPMFDSAQTKNLFEIFCFNRFALNKLSFPIQQTFLLCVSVSLSSSTFSLSIRINHVTMLSLFASLYRFCSKCIRIIFNNHHLPAHSRQRKNLNADQRAWQ